MKHRSKTTAIEKRVKKWIPWILMRVDCDTKHILYRREITCVTYVQRRRAPNRKREVLSNFSSNSITTHYDVTTDKSGSHKRDKSHLTAYQRSQSVCVFTHLPLRCNDKLTHCARHGRKKWMKTDTVCIVTERSIPSSRKHPRSAWEISSSQI